MDNNQKHSQVDNTFWVGLFLGGLIGAMMIVILGTEKGKKLAEKLTEEGWEWLDDAKDKVSQKKQQIQEKVKQLSTQGKALEEQIETRINDTKSELTEKTLQQADNALAHIEQLQERGRRSTAEIRKRLFKNIPKKDV